LKETIDRIQGTPFLLINHQKTISISTTVRLIKENFLLSIHDFPKS
jgi:hypothetical protein